MITNSRIIAIALIAALVGGSLGAIAMRSSEASRQSTPVATTNTTPDSANLANTSAASYNDASYDTASGLAIPMNSRRPKSRLPIRSDSRMVSGCHRTS